MPHFVLTSVLSCRRTSKAQQLWQNLGGDQGYSGITADWRAVHQGFVRLFGHSHSAAGIINHD